MRENYAAIAIPVDVRKRRHADYQGAIFVHLGYRDMCTLSSGAVYGESLGHLLETKTERLTEKNRERHRLRSVYKKSLAVGNRKKALAIESNNLGLVKYARQKNRERAEIETYINTELNRMLEAEKPGRIVITSPIVGKRTKFRSKAANRKLTESFRGYIRNRLQQKCEANLIELVEISPKDTGSICAECGALGKRLSSGFVCEKCGYSASTALNGARNIEKKYRHLLNE